MRTNGLRKKFDSGETIYKSGHYDEILVGQRGVGFKTTQTLHDFDSASVKIDGKSIPSQITTLSEIQNAYIFKKSKDLMPLILKAKTIQVLFNTCGSAFKSSPLECLYTSKVAPYSVTWEFEKPLESYDLTGLGINK